jgi:hypothetical protein
MIFSVEERERVRDRLVEMARADSRVVACALVGAEADGRADRWSDVDVTLGVGDGVAVDEVLADWTRVLGDELGAAHLFDLQAGSSVYRVFLLESSLQVDVSFTPQRDFGARGPRFRLLFGHAVERPPAEPPRAQQVFGFAVHHVVRARICIERGRAWQAEYWISGVRDEALALACRREGLEAAYGRGLDRLSPELLGEAEHALVRSLDRGGLLRALGAAVRLLEREADGLGEEGARLARQMQALSQPDALAAG